jgi:hypothetical protein
MMLHNRASRGQHQKKQTATVSYSAIRLYHLQGPEARWALAVYLHRKKA